MDRTNSSRKRIAQYIRVSSEEQAKRGFSIPDQKRELDLWAEGKGYQVVETFIDDGYEGTFLERPGLDRLRDLAEAGAIDAVVVWKRTRLSREPAHMWILEKEFRDKGVELIFLDSSTDDTPEGQLMSGMLDQLSKYELDVLKDRTRRGSLQRVRSGKVIIANSGNYGFRPNADRDGYLVDEETAPVVRRIFDMVANQGKSLHKVVNTLNAEGIPSPAGKKWSRAVVRRMILDDVYKPHDPAEIAALTGRPAPAGPMGIWYYNRRTIKVWRDPETYKRKTKTTIKPKDQWIAVAVPAIGIPRPVVDNARKVVLSNGRTYKAGRRFWELDSGILRCCNCGWAMSARSIVGSDGKTRFYYVCSSYSTRPRPCNAVKHYRAELVEQTAAAMVEPLVADKDRLVSHVQERLNQQRKRIRRGTPESEIADIMDRLAKIDTKRRNFQIQQAEGAMTIAELKEMLAGLDAERQQLQDQLQAANRTAEQLADLEREAKIIIGMYAGRLANFQVLEPSKRQDVYRRLGLTANFIPLQNAIVGSP